MFVIEKTENQNVLKHSAVMIIQGITIKLYDRRL